MVVLKGAQARSLIVSQVQKHGDGIVLALAEFEATTTTRVWMEAIRGIEEFINLLLHGLGDHPLVEQVLASLEPSPAGLASRRGRYALHHVTYVYGSGFAERLELFVQQADIARHFLHMVGLHEAASSLRTGASAVGYLQSRRRHLVALMHTLPVACRGSVRLGPKTSWRYMLPIIEYSGATLTGLVQHLALVELCSDFELATDGEGFRGNRSYPSLSSTFLEPERLPIVEAATSVPPSAILSNVPDDKLFSVAELKRDIELMEFAYAEFDLRKKGFGQMADLVAALGSLSDDDFSISISQKDFEDLATAHGLTDALRDEFLFKGTTYLNALNTYAPLVRIGSGELRTSVTFLSRFLYFWKNVCLYRNRRFQIRSGFEFERHVRQELEAQGYQLTTIKRIKRKEFDVVAIRDNVVFNVQCKNNLVISPCAAPLMDTIVC